MGRKESNQTNKQTNTLATTIAAKYHSVIFLIFLAFTSKILSVKAF